MTSPSDDDESRFAAMEPEQLRLLASTRARLLSAIGRDEPTIEILHTLCRDAGTLLGAQQVTVALNGSTEIIRAPSRSVEDSQAGRAPGSEEEATQEASTVTIRSSNGDPLGELVGVWSSGRTPGEDETWLLSEFGLLAQIALEMHRSQQDRLTAIATERDRIAGQLHDDPIQTMTAVSLRLQHLATGLTDPSDVETVEEIRRLADEAVERLRHMLFSLHPQTLEEDGLAVSLELYCESYVEPEGIESDVIADLPDSLPSGVAALAFRLARGAIVNVVKHAHASRISIELVLRASSLYVVVRDDGVGFDTAQLGHTEAGHFGIDYARSLAGLGGGRYEVASCPDRGTEVTISLPVL